MSAAKIREKVAFTILGLATAMVVLPIILTILYLVKNGIGAISWEFLSQPPRNGMKEGGIFPAIIGTILLIIGTMAFAMPLGILAAVYLVEYAKDNYFTRLIKLSVVNLSGIPSIVYGLFGFTLFVLFLRLGTSILAGSLTLAIMSLPVIITTSKEASRPCLTVFARLVCPSEQQNGRPFDIACFPMRYRAFLLEWF